MRQNNTFYLQKVLARLLLQEIPYQHVPVHEEESRKDRPDVHPLAGQKIYELRQAGEVVIQSLPGHESEQDEFDCNRAVVFDDGQWILNNVG